MAVGGVARNCVKTTVKVADATQPVWAQTRNLSKTYRTDDEVLKQAIKVADFTKNATQLSQPKQEANKNDTIKIMLTPIVLEGK